MCQARSDEQWNHTAALLAMLVNINRDPRKGRAMKPADFHPGMLRTAARAGAPKADIRLLKAVFVDGR
jgi:hypothetical protein